jgi:phospholipase D
MNKTKKAIKKKYQHLFNIIVVALLVGFATGYIVSGKDTQQFFDNNNQVQPTISDYDPVLVGFSEISLCFTPPTGCARVIANLISEAKESVYVQAYGITSNEIVDQLIAAHARGVKVRILIDKSNLTDKYSKMQQMLAVGINVSIDKVSGIAHNKVIIIDERKVITGSFNFTKSADTRNAENVIIVNDRHVASKYLQNWLSRKSNNEHRSASDTNKSNTLKVKSNVK